MQFQTALDAVSAEVAFRVVRSSLTETLTATDRFVTGDPVILATATASADGNYIARPGNLNALVNNLFVGMVHSPDDRARQTRTRAVLRLRHGRQRRRGDRHRDHSGIALVPGTNRSLEIVAFVNPTGTATGDTGVGDGGTRGLRGGVQSADRDDCDRDHARRRGYRRVPPLSVSTG